MTLQRWLRSLAFAWLGQAHKWKRKPRQRSHIQLETLENRVAPVSSLSIGDVSMPKGNSGTQNMNFTVTRTGDTSAGITTSYQTVDGTAQAGADYVALSGLVTIPAGSTSATISVPILGNTIPAPTKTFTVNLTGSPVAFTEAPTTFSRRRPSLGAGRSPTLTATTNPILLSPTTTAARFPCFFNVTRRQGATSPSSSQPRPPSRQETTPPCPSESPTSTAMAGPTFSQRIPTPDRCKCG